MSFFENVLSSFFCLNQEIHYEKEGLFVSLTLMKTTF